MKTYSLIEALESGKDFRNVDQKPHEWFAKSFYPAGHFWSHAAVLARYILKQEPREWIVWIDKDGNPSFAKAGFFNPDPHGETIGVREVFE